ncbi:MAG: hypothetical protein ACO4CH_00010 [Saprospiraceae bacterium]|jgi:membrane protein implicated in regulation of membrane protease activity
MLQIQLSEWWNLLSETQKVFWGVSIIFSVLFLIQFVVSLFGVDFDGDADVDFETDGHAVPQGTTMDGDFALFSVRSVIAFFTFFGWTGVLALHGGASVLVTVILSSLSGMAAMLLVAFMMFWFSRLTQSGTLDIQEAVHKRGEVYLPVPAHKLGVGKVHVQLKGSLREMDAVTDGDALSTGTPVRILEVIDGEVLLVEKGEPLLHQ